MRMLWFYVAVIGACMIGIVAVLWVGNHLVAPPAIGGSWSMFFSAGSAATTECLEASGWTNPSSLHVSQSGKFLALSFGESGHSAMSGRLQDMAITATSPDVGTSPDSASSLNVGDEAIGAWHATHLVADVQRDVETPEQLAGQLAIAGCDEPVTFVATDRIVTNTQGSGGH